MRYLSLFSGIEAATQAFHPLGWEPAAFAEIEPFPAAVLAHHYPEVPNLGNVTNHKEWPDIGTVDVVCGGSPCQSFSVAGLRQGMADPRGNLALVYLAIVDQYRPKWVIYENVPGVLSSNGGRDFGAFLGGLGQIGYGFAYRVLDAQFVRTRRFGGAVPQRRRRVFVVGYLGDWRRAAAVLFDRESLRGNPPPRREAGQNPAGTLDAGLGSRGAPQGERGHLIPQGFGGWNTSGAIDAAACLTAKGQRIDFEVETFVAHTLRGEGFDAREDGTGRGAPIVPVPHPMAIQERAVCENPNAGPDGVGIRTDGAAYTLEARTVSQAIAFDCLAGGETGLSVGEVPGARHGGGKSGGRSAVAFDLNQITSKTNRSRPDPAVHHTLTASTCPPHLALPWAVRRLTPEECEALQGFPRGYTAIPYRNRMAADGPRYKALGNSMAVNVVEWIGERINMVDAIQV